MSRQHRRLLNLHEQLKQATKTQQQQQQQQQLGAYNLVWPQDARVRESLEGRGRAPSPSSTAAAAAPRFPAHWGQPPRALRRDMVGWPENYGRGSSTIRDWIKHNMKDDEQAAVLLKHGGQLKAWQQASSSSSNSFSNPTPSTTPVTTVVKPAPIKKTHGGGGGCGGGKEEDGGEAGALVAIGDVHGSLANLHATLYKNKLVDQEAGDWIGGARTVVQTGDLIGRGADDKDVIEYVRRLQSQAKAAGGEWVQLMGNHEWMELHRNYAYANDGPNGVGYGSTEARDREFQTGEHGAWLRALPVMHTWNDVVFTHGGLSSPSMASLGVGTLNAHVAAYMNGHHTDTRVADELLWSRTLAQGDETKVCPVLSAVFDELNGHGNGHHRVTGADAGGITKMVVGHTITATTGEFAPGELGSRCSGALQMIDVGMSSYFKSIPKLWRAAHFFHQRSDAESESESESEGKSNVVSVGLGSTDQNPTEVLASEAASAAAAVPSAAVGHYRLEGGVDPSADVVAFGKADVSRTAPKETVWTKALTPEEEEEELEREAMAEAIAEPRTGPNGEDRSAPGYRDGDGSGRKDFVRAEPAEPAEREQNEPTAVPGAVGADDAADPKPVQMVVI